LSHKYIRVLYYIVGLEPRYLYSTKSSRY